MDSTKEEKAKRAKRKRNGEMESLILTALRNAGESGMSVKELATSLSIKPGSLHAWFFLNAKQGDSLEKIGRGKYRLKTVFQGNIA
jgi:hypothetical protein